MNPLKALFGKGDVGPRPDLAGFVPGGPRPAVLLVDGATPPAGDVAARELAGCETHRHEPHAGPGVPFREDDDRRLPPGAGGRPAVVLLDVLDRVLDPAFALRACAESLAPEGCLVVVQQVAPDDLDARGAWNALARLRDDRHTWTPTRRQVRATCGDAGFVRDGEALWEEELDVSSGVREATASLHATYVRALEANGLVRGGRLTVRRLALVLRPR